jgi:hypothetical protein
MNKCWLIGVGVVLLATPPSGVRGDENTARKEK